MWPLFLSYKTSAVLCFGTGLGEDVPAVGVLTDCQNKHTRNKPGQAAASATSVLS